MPGMELSREMVQRRLAEDRYLADPQLATAITLIRRLERPLLLERPTARGDPGAGTGGVESLAALEPWLAGL